MLRPATPMDGRRWRRLIVSESGKYQGEDVSVQMRMTSVPTFLLATRGFHWVSEYPYNR